MAAKTFKEYLAKWDAEARPRDGEAQDHCDQCGGPDPITRDALCRACVRYHQGYDEAEEALAHAIVGGAVKGALEGYVSPEIIAVAVQRAFQEHRDRQEESAFRWGATVAEGRR